jgi:chorismate synthase
MIERIKEVRAAQGDSVGGVIHCRIRGVPPGLGEPVFDRLEADLAKAMLSLPATKGFEIGSGFAGTLLKGSEHNDAFVPMNGGVRHRDQPLGRRSRAGSATARRSTSTWPSSRRPRSCSRRRRSTSPAGRPS